MNLEQLKSQGFLMPDLVKKMGNTVPGVLADLIDRFLYYLAEEKEGEQTRLRFYNTKVFVNRGLDPMLKKPYPLIAGMTEDGNYIDLRRGLREVFHYLEACALREAQQS